MSAALNVLIVDDELPARERLLGRAQPIQLRSAETRRVLQRFFEPFTADGLQ